MKNNIKQNGATGPYRFYESFHRKVAAHALNNFTTVRVSMRH